jgi:S-DNA-T family DNA segregation ATPase FtsK/SpoIIIE
LDGKYTLLFRNSNTAHEIIAIFQDFHVENPRNTRPKCLKISANFEVLTKTRKLARAKKNTPNPDETSTRNEDLGRDERPARIAGLFLFLFSLFLTLSCISYLLSGSHDQQYILTANAEGAVYANWMGAMGAHIAHALMFTFAGVSALCIPFLLLLISLRLLFGTYLFPIWKSVSVSVGLLLFVPLAIGFFAHKSVTTPLPGIEFRINGLFIGGYGKMSTLWCVSHLGWMGTLLSILFVSITFAIINFNHHVDAAMKRLAILFRSKPKEQEPRHVQEVEEEDPLPFHGATTVEVQVEPLSVEPDPVVEPIQPTTKLPQEPVHAPLETSFDFDAPPSVPDPFILIEEEDEEDEKKTTNLSEAPIESEVFHLDPTPEIVTPETDLDSLGIEIAQTNEEEVLSKEEIETKEFGEYDPKLDLSRYVLPSIDLLANHGGQGPQISKEELEENKNRIIETLNHYKIEISKIKATIGPTVTLYEIVPAPGVRISKIKSLEDDIALSLAALGIRIIAPIPGKGTIGIEVPNSRPDVVSMRSLIASDKFQNADMELPIALGKTISNEIFVTDLAKMPHLLMAGSTGQGKSVGLNAILVSLLYRKHPSQVKFVLVDPKKVELTLFNKIERHFLAKLPDEAESIIIDTSKVVKTLNSLCIEMDERYKLLTTATCRNIKEYNKKFIERKLNPNDGHRYLPYIVLVVDEFADLIMTAGREVETPIARLAQLARAIGIHLIVATQRPSVNVITGLIKANFPARIAFRVTSKIDSRTILDAGGADQLIGRGDMLFSTGNDLTRIQCGFVDTPEVESITEYIGNQQGYPHAYHLPEVQDENSMEIGNFEDQDRDSLFEDAARIIVLSQQGSASLLQRKLKLGYNRAGRLIDQLEAAGIIGPFEGSKARKVLIPDEISLEQFLKNLG